jgi:hypothetical protein
MLKYISKFTMDILPSLAATIIGAYIVNHYIVAKPGVEAPAAAVSSVEPKKADVKASAKPSEAAKPSETASDDSSLPEPGVRAKGISEKAVLEKSAVETAVQKPADKSSETASLAVDSRRHPPTPREKTVSKPVSVPIPPAATAAAPVVAAPNSAPSAEAANAPEEHRDANDLARAAIERLRGISDNSPRAAEPGRIPEPTRVVTAPPMSAPAVAVPSVRPLPPPIMVSTPPAEPQASVTGSTQARPLYPDTVDSDDPSRPTPPADIPLPPLLPPLVLHAEATGPSMREHTSVAQDMLAAARSVFHAVLPLPK